MIDERWPTATLDPIRRARVLAAAMPGGFAETVFDVPYARAWPWLTDFERSVPAFDALVDRLRITDRQVDPDGNAENLRFTSTKFHVPLRFTARVEDGWCVMRASARAFVVVIAAMPDGPDRTRYAQLEAVPLPGGQLLRRRFTRDVHHDIAGIRRLLAST